MYEIQPSKIKPFDIPVSSRMATTIPESTLDAFTKESVRSPKLSTCKYGSRLRLNPYLVIALDAGGGHVGKIDPKFGITPRRSWL